MKSIAEYNARASVLDNPAYLADLDADIALHQPLESAPEWVGGFADPMADVIAWPALEAIPDEATTAPDAFPFHALGSIMGDAARAIAGDVQAPDSLAGGSVLAAASLAVQPLANVVLPQPVNRLRRQFGATRQNNAVGLGWRLRNIRHRLDQLRRQGWEYAT